MRAIQRLDAHETGRVFAEAMEMDFDEVIVFGYKGGQIYSCHSKTADRLKIIGALEAAKLSLWGDGESV